MSTEIIKVLEYLGEKFGIVIDWTAENVMPYATQLFKRFTTLKITYAGIGVFVGLMLVIFVMILLSKLIKEYKLTKEKDDDTACWHLYNDGSVDPTGLGFAIVCVMITMTIVGVITLCVSTHNLIQWIIIPEVPFAKEIMNVINTGTTTV